MSVLKQLASSNYISVNKTLIKLFGLEEAVLIGELCSEYDYWERNNKLENGMFFSTIANVEENTGLSEYQQRTAIHNLENYGILEVKVSGLPAKRYFKFNENKLLNFLQSSSEKIKELDTEKLNSNNNQTNKNKEIKNSNSNELLADADTESFLGSVSKSTDKPKKKNVYQKCVDMINDFTDNPQFKDLLLTYLKYRLEIREKPLYANMWKGMLRSLDGLCGDDDDLGCEIVQQSINRGYLGFYAVNKRSSTPTFDHTKHVDYSEDYDQKQSEWLEEMKRDGKRTEF